MTITTLRKGFAISPDGEYRTFEFDDPNSDFNVLYRVIDTDMVEVHEIGNLAFWLDENACFKADVQPNVAATRLVGDLSGRAMLGRLLGTVVVTATDDDGEIAGLDDHMIDALAAILN